MFKVGISTRPFTITVCTSNPQVINHFARYDVFFEVPTRLNGLFAYRASPYPFGRIYPIFNACQAKCMAEFI
jgi:hypothetical protein